MLHRRIAVFGLLALALILGGCAELAAIAPPTPTALPSELATSVAKVKYWPTRGWRTSSPTEQGMDAGRLAAMFDEIEAQGLSVHGVVVVRNGYVVAERYFAPYDAGTKHVQYSVTKSFVSTLVGIALDERRLPSVDVPVLDLFPDRSFASVGAEKRAMTVEHLLTMTSGLDWPESDATFAQMYRQRDWLGYVLDIPMVERPGSRFRYCSGCSHVLSEMVGRVTGSNTLDYAREKLLGPLGISDFTWERAADGVPIGGWGLHLTPRDMAKPGYLYLNGGFWDGRQVVSASWLRAATSRHVTADDGFGYGYQWWLHDRLDAYFARGREGQLVFVVPDKQLVVVITADESSDRPLLRLIADYVVSAAG